ncbi:MAG: Polyamine-transporting ATPase [Firmicutes bacterium]|nr:Polyamine-transporting ATPase [Bacillota bacterium]
MSEYILEMRHVTVDRGARKNILNIEAFGLRPGELVAVVGPNGAGKSTLLQVINLLHAYHGGMKLFGQKISNSNKTMLRRRAAMVFQDMLLLNDTVFNNVALALRFRGVKEGEIKERVYKALADFRCDHLANRSALLLSGGEAQRVCIARALVTMPELLLLDEPFAALDAATRDELIEEIRQLAGVRGIAVVLVSHNFADVLHFAERALMLFNGHIVQDDKPEFIMRRPANEQVARLVGMDNIIPCCSEQDSQGRFIRLANGIRFLYHGEVCEPISVCCLPGDALYLWDKRRLNQRETWVMVEGVVERVIPGVGTYRILIKLGEQMLSARVPPHHVTDDIHSYSRVKLAFNPAEVHIV